MNDIAVISNNNLTMSSVEIAQACEKRHDNVMADIRKMLDELKIQSPEFLGGYKDSKGRTYPCYFLPERELMILVSGYRTDLRAKIIDRWQELENQQRPPTALAPSRKELALMVIQAEEENERLQLENLQMKPKADFVDRYVEIGSSKSLRETAKILGMQEKAMISRLIDDKALYRQSANLLPYADKLSKGLFTVKTGTAEHGHNFTQTRVTGKGIEWIAQRYASELGL